MSEEMKRCPFCGCGGGKFLQILPTMRVGIVEWWAVHCANCGAKGPDTKRKDGAPELWNECVDRDWEDSRHAVGAATIGDSPDDVATAAWASKMVGDVKCH